MKFVRPNFSHSVLALGAVLFASTALAAAEPDPACRGAKLKAAGKYASAVLGCAAKAAKDGVAVDPTCTSNGEIKLADAFEAAESKNAVDCNGLDEATETTVEDTADDVGDASPVASGGGVCPSSVRKAAGKFASSLLGAWSKFVLTGDAAKRDASLTKARGTLAGKITKAEEKEGCTSTGQGEAVRNAVELGLSSIVGCLSSAEECLESVDEVAAGGTATSDPEAMGPDADTPVTAEIETPNAGTVVLRVAEATSEAPGGYEVLGTEVEISAPDATTGDPLVLTFVIDASLLPADPNTVEISRDGVIVSDCTGAPGTADPDPCVQSRTVLGNGDLEIVVLSSHASLWTPLVPLVTGCPTVMLWEMRADAAGDETATEIDVGWTGLAHSFDPTSGTAITFGMDCAAANAPCGTCNVTGFDPSSGNCRCANDSRIACDEPFTADTDCGGSTCQCFLRAPLPMVIGGTPACAYSVARTEASGTWNVEAGSGDVVLNELLKVHTGNDVLSPCPVCVGDTPGDGVRSGLCEGGDSDGLGCEAHAGDPTFPYPTGGHYSIDCLPSAASSITGQGMRIDRTETTGTSTLTASMPCVGNAGESCACAVCTGNSNLGCSSDAQCASAGAGTCTSSGFGGSVQPDSCSVSCTVDGDGEGLCGIEDTLGFCDGIVEEDGRGVVSCFDDNACDALSANLSIDAGTCAYQFRPCFGSTISATGATDPDSPRTVATTCMPPTSNNAVNSALGLPGAGRVRTDWFATMIE